MASKIIDELTKRNFMKDGENGEQCKGTLKYLIIYNYFKELIRSGMLKQGEKLPTENQIEDKFNVSRITVIRALNQLQEDKLIVRKQGSGSFVAKTEEPVNGDLNIISLVMSFKGRGRQLELIESIEDFFKKRGYLISVSNSERSSKTEREIINSIKSKVKGIILYPVNSHENADLYLSLFNEQYPLVFIDRYPFNVPCDYVVSDNFDGGYKIGKYIADKGHKKIAFISYNITEYTSGRDRFNGFMTAISEHNIQRKFVDLILLNSHQETEMLEDVVKRLFSDRHLSEKPTALFICNDYLAFIVMKILAESGYELPENFIIAGFDSADKKPYDFPFVTVKQFHYKIGETAAELLFSKITNKSFVSRQCSIPVELVEDYSVRLPEPSSARISARI